MWWTLRKVLGQADGFPISIISYKARCQGQQYGQMAEPMSDGILLAAHNYEVPFPRSPTHTPLPHTRKSIL